MPNIRPVSLPITKMEVLWLRLYLEMLLLLIMIVA